jgi:hypothetical protein
VSVDALVTQTADETPCGLGEPVSWFAVFR